MGGRSAWSDARRLRFTIATPLLKVLRRPLEPKLRSLVAVDDRRPFFGLTLLDCIANAFVTRVAVGCESMDQPTTRRLNVSRTTAQ
jgi:hypothetical protein